MGTGDGVHVVAHEVSDGQHVFRDEPGFAIVLATGPGDFVDVVIFPPGGPTLYERLYPVTDETYKGTHGRHYRPWGSDPLESVPFGDVPDDPIVEPVADDDGEEAPPNA